MYTAAAVRSNELCVGLGNMSSTRVLLSDDHSFMRRGLRNILEATEHYEVCGEAGDGVQTLKLANQLAPDILILDISMPPPNGLEVASQLRQALPKTKILMITMHDSEEMLRAAAAAGECGSAGARKSSPRPRRSSSCWITPALNDAGELLKPWM